MKRNHLKIFITLAAVAIPVFVLATPHFAYADCGLLGPNSSVLDCVFMGTSWIAELCFAAAGALLTITGVLLNGAMVATLNISQIVTYTPAIGIAWRTLRDFSSIFIIFLLLWASIMMILGLDGTIGFGLGKLIKNIIIAGLLINFSLFFTKLLVDTSNIVSLSFYNAIAPGQSTVASSNSAAGAFTGMISNAFNDGGISNVFMQKLDIQQIDAAKTFTSAAGTNPNKYQDITLAYAGGTVLMVTAAFSFLFAAVTFAVRLSVLLLLMAFSPIYFIGMILPKTKEYADKWLKTLICMCTFMPIYLLLMYVAMSVINDPAFFNFAKVSSVPSSASGTVNSIVSASTVGIVLQYIIAFFFINAPMVAALALCPADKVMEWGKAAKNWTQGVVGRNTVGRLGEGTEKFLDKYAPTLSNTLVGQTIRKNTSGAAANAGWDSGKSRTVAAKESKERGTKQRSIDRINELRDAIKKNDAGRVKTALDTFTDSEKVSLDKDILTNELVIPHLSEGVFSKIESGTMSDKDKLAISEKRIEFMSDLSQKASAGDKTAADTLTNMMKNASGKTLAEFDNHAKGKGAFNNSAFIANLRPSQLKDMDTMDRVTRSKIGSAISYDPTHPAHKYINDNIGVWS